MNDVGAAERPGMVLGALGALVGLVVVFAFLLTQSGGYETEYRLYADGEIGEDARALVEVTRWRRDTGRAVEHGDVSLVVREDSGAERTYELAVFSPMFLEERGPVALHVIPPEGDALAMRTRISEQAGRESEAVERRAAGIEVVDGTSDCGALQLDLRAADGALTANVAEVMVLHLSDASGAPVAGVPVGLEGMGVQLSAAEVMPDSAGLASFRLQLFQRSTLRAEVRCDAGVSSFFVELTPYFDGLGFASDDGLRAAVPTLAGVGGGRYEVRFRLQDATMHEAPRAQVVCDGDVVATEVLSEHRRTPQSLRFRPTDRLSTCWLQIFHRPHAPEAQRVTWPLLPACGSAAESGSDASLYCAAQRGERFLPPQFLASDGVLRDAAHEGWRTLRRRRVHLGFGIGAAMAVLGVLLIGFSRRRAPVSPSVEGDDDDLVLATLRPANGAMIVVIAGLLALMLLFGGMYLTMRLMGL